MIATTGLSLFQLNRVKVFTASSQSEKVRPPPGTPSQAPNALPRRANAGAGSSSIAW